MQTVVIFQPEDRPGWWVEEARREAAARDGRSRPYTQTSLAAAIGKDRATVQRWESTRVEHVVWIGILTILGLPKDWEPAPRA